MKILKSILKNRKLVIYLSKNDMKKKYAGSYLGVMWAFVQPVVQILIYWFVFEVGLRAAGANNHPFIVWIICGLIPWFFFSDALNSATTCFLEYSYLVKKVVFDIEILPIIKIISSFIVHLFFIVLLLIVLTIFGYFPSIFAVQIIYYTICLVLLIIALSYITACLNVFFPDLAQIVQVGLQVGIWMTPIMWNFEMLAGQWFSFIFKLNPLFYIVQGYRSALLEGQWFWQTNLTLTLYFWGFVIFFLFVGSKVFKKLKPHFSDSL